MCKAEDRIRELQREVVAKEEQRLAIWRYSDGVEKKMVQAQEDARVYLKTVEGGGERLACVAVCCCSVLQCVAVCCSVLQCVAVCCSALQ